MAAVTHDNDMIFEPHMKGPLFSSAILHFAVIVIAIIGLPYMTPELPEMQETITVELVNADDVDTMTTVPEKKPVKAPAEQSREEPPKPVMPTVTAKKPPRPVSPAPPDIEDFAPPEKVPEPVKKPEPIKVKTPPKKPKIKPTLTRDPAEEQQEFTGVLRNLMKNEAISQDKTDNPDKGKAQPSYSQLEVNRLAQSINRQLSNCWSLMAGARYAEDLIVKLKLFMNPDGSVRDAHIVDQLRYNTDSFYRAAADGARRAVFNPQCNPLDLPYDKYDLWKVINASFDPSKML